MKPETFEANLIRLMSETPPSDQELAELQQLFESNPQLTEEVTDQRVVDALLRFETQTPDSHETFIRNCVAKTLAAQATPPPRQNAEKPPRLPEINRDPKKDVATEESPSVSQETLNHVHRKYPWRLGLLATLAASLLIVLATIQGLRDPQPPRQSIRTQPGTPNARALGPPRGDAVPSQDTIPEEATLSPPVDVAKPNLDRPAGGFPMPQGREATPLQKPLEKAIATAEPGQTSYANLTTSVSKSKQEQLTNKRVGAGPLAVLSGRGQLTFDTGLIIFFETPFSATIESADSLVIHEGAVYLEAPSTTASFQVATTDHRWAINGKTDLQLSVDSMGTQECYVFRGQVDLKTDVLNDKSPQSSPLAITSSGLNQVLIEPGQTTTAPSILVARGQNQFLGQIGLPTPVIDKTSKPHSSAWRTDSPAQFAKIANRLFSANDEESQKKILQDWTQFLKQTQQMDFRLPNARSQFDQLMGQFLGIEPPVKNEKKERDGLPLAPTLFQGNINLNDIEKHLETIKSMNRKTGNKPANQTDRNPMGLDRAPGAFSAEMNLNGRSIKFSSPTQFDNFRRRAKR